MSEMTAIKIGNCGRVSVKYIAKSIESLARNNIGEVGAQVLARSLRTNASLQKLELGHNRIGDEGTKALAKAIESSHTPVLEAVTLTSTRMTDTGAPAFGQSFNNRHVLTCVVSGFQHDWNPWNRSFGERFSTK